MMSRDAVWLIPILVSHAIHSRRATRYEDTKAVRLMVRRRGNNYKLNSDIELYAFTRRNVDVMYSIDFLTAIHRIRCKFLSYTF